MNKVFLIGNITRDVDIAETNNGVKVCHFSLAVNRGFGSTEDRQTDFFNITAWRGTAENIAKFCKKGSKVAVSGSIQIRQYEDENGNKKIAVDIIAQEVEFLSRVNTDGNKTSKPTLDAYDDDSDLPY